MTLRVDDFKEEGPALGLGDYEGEVSPGAHLNNKTASQLAATDSLLTDPTSDGYRLKKEDLLDPSRRKEFLLRQEEMRGLLHEDAKESTLDIITEPLAPYEDKVLSAAGSAISRAEASKQSKSTLAILAEEAVISDSGVNETEQSAESRNSMIDSIDEVVTHKRQVASRIAELRLGKDSTIGDKIVDMAEIVAPFAEWIHIDRLQKDVTGGAEVAALGQQKQMLFDEIKSLPISDRGLFVENIIKLMEEHEDVILNDGNDLLNLDILENMLLDDDYSDFERWFDNATSILEVTGVAGLARKTLKSGKLAKAGSTVEQLAEDLPADFQARSAATHSDVSPASPSQVVKDYNPEQSRNIHTTMKEDPTEEAAEALYGSSKTEAMAKDLLPEPEIVEGTLPNKVEMKRPVHEEPEKIKELRLANGNTAVSEKEMGRVVENVIDGFENVVGYTHKGDSVVKTNLDGTYSVSMRFSPVDSGYRTAAQAVENAKFAFRNYGVSDEHLTLYARNGDEWVKTSQEELTAKAALREGFTARKKKIPDELKDIDYIVGLDYNYRFRPEDLTEVDLLQTGNMVTKTLDSLGSQGLAKAGQGSLVQNMFDASSVIHPQIVNPASVAVDRALGLKKLYVDAFQDFTDFWQKLPRDRRAAVTDYINQANFEGIALNTTDLYARGFSKSEVDALKVWREANDAMWHASNADMVKTLRGQGFRAVVHTDTDTMLVGRPMTRTAAMQSRTVYDPVDGTNIRLETGEVDDLYEAGGELVKLGSPIQVDGQWIDTAMSRNTSQGGYTRDLYEGEVVLSYRDGYYPVSYEANHFVRKTITLADGTKERKIVASAKNRQEAEEAVARLQASDPEAEFDFRKDRRLEQEKSDRFDEGSWSVAQSAGLTSQKVRGERLLDAGSDLHKASNSNLKDPLQAVADQIHQLSQRVSMRTYLETVKKRWLLNYGKHLDLPTDPATGQMVWPKSISEVKGKPTSPQKLVADARTNFNYVYGLENGYINLVDKTFKGILNQAADWMGELGLSKLEEGLFDIGKTNPTQQAKTLAFRMFISANPARQAVIQRGQMLQLGAANPAYIPQMVNDLVKLDLARTGALKGDKRTQELLKEIEDVGILQAVDAHNLIREDALRLADLTFVEKSKTIAGKPLEVLQKWGFDLAEQDVLLSSYLAHRDLAVKAGKNMKSQRVKDEVLGQARAFTLTMNRAGEMPYSQNTIGLPAQFFSFRHKAFLQPIFNKSLSKKQRAQLLGYTTALFGVDATILGVGYDAIWGKTPPNDMKDKIEDGMLDVTLNTALTLASGTDQMIDFGDFAPTEAYGIGNVFAGMLTTDISEMVANAPAGSLLFGNNARVTQAFKTGMRYFSVIDDYEDPALETKLSDVAQASAHLFSGYSSIFKARLAYQTRQKMSSSGRITDADVTAVEALWAGLGFQTKTEVGYRETNEQVFGDSNFTTDDVKTWYNDLKRQLARRGTSVTEDDFAQRVTAEAWRVFNDDRPKAVDVILRELEKDAANNDYTMFNRVVKKMGFVTEDETWKMINAMPPGQVRDRLTETMQVGKETLNGN